MLGAELIAKEFFESPCYILRRVPRSAVLKAAIGTRLRQVAEISVVRSAR